MNPTPSSQSGSRVQSIHHEIRSAENSCAHLLPTLRSMRHSNPSLRVLDVGCGSGTISATLAKEIPDGDVVATDVKLETLTRARAVAKERGAPNISFQQASVFELPFPDDSFDIVHCHQVLCHLPEPWKGLREMYRVVKPGGVVSAREGDVETQCIWPESPHMLAFNQFTADLVESNGGSRKAGRELLSWALKAGVRRDQITPSFGTWYYVEPGEKEAWARGIINLLQSSRLKELARDRNMSEGDLTGMVSAWKEWCKADDATVALMHGEVIIKK